MSQLLLSMFQNADEVGYNASAGMDASERESNRAKIAGFLLLCSLHRLPADVSPIKGGSSHRQRPGLKVGLPTSKDLMTTKFLTGVPGCLGFSRFQT